MTYGSLFGGLDNNGNVDDLLLGRRADRGEGLAGHSIDPLVFDENLYDGWGEKEVS